MPPAVRAPGDGTEKVRAAAAGDAAAAAALWDAHGPRAYAFCRRVLGDADAAADATQDAFLLALAHDDEDFAIALLRAARRTSFELLAAGRGAGRAAGSGLAAATAQLRPQQRAALALSGLPYAAIAAVLGIGVEAVPALLARARLRVHDELHGTALAAAAARSPDCEDVVPLLAAAADDELDAADAAWADPHVLRCPTCPRIRRAMAEAAATYAAWSPVAPPSWLRAATLADVGAETPVSASVPVAAGPLPPRRARRRAAGAWATPRPSLTAALAGTLLVTAAFAALLVAGVGALRQDDGIGAGAQLADGARSVRVADVPAPRAHQPAAGHAPRRTKRAHRAAPRAQRVTYVPVAAVRRVPARAPSSPPQHRASTRPHVPAARPKRTRTPRPTTTSTSPPPTPSEPAPVSADAPADETPATAAAAPTTAAAAPTTATATAAVPTTPATAVATAPATATAPTPAIQTPAQPTGHAWRRGDRDRDARSQRGPCRPHGHHDR
jgi:DNA-directed RNA polymerase specialized sigma24 family protein